MGAISLHQRGASTHTTVPGEPREDAVTGKEPPRPFRLAALGRPLPCVGNKQSASVTCVSYTKNCEDCKLSEKDGVTH